mmetsp:Transcript_104543/g.305210  ORF Transcript_104543/g.305210 Transcript_104543/m.305210 type:complete len:472 (-) Transcript_104543:3819-5234(-)
MSFVVRRKVSATRCVEEGPHSAESEAPSVRTASCCASLRCKPVVTKCRSGHGEAAGLPPLAPLPRPCAPLAPLPALALASGASGASARASGARAGASASAPGRGLALLTRRRRLGVEAPARAPPACFASPVAAPDRWCIAPDTSPCLLFPACAFPSVGHSGCAPRATSARSASSSSCISPSSSSISGAAAPPTTTTEPDRWRLAPDACPYFPLAAWASAPVPPCRCMEATSSSLAPSSGSAASSATSSSIWGATAPRPAKVAPGRARLALDAWACFPCAPRAVAPERLWCCRSATMPSGLLPRPPAWNSCCPPSASSSSSSSSSSSMSCGAALPGAPRPAIAEPGRWRLALDSCPLFPCAPRLASPAWPCSCTPGASSSSSSSSSSALLPRACEAAAPLQALPARTEAGAAARWPGLPWDSAEGACRRGRAAAAAGAADPLFLCSGACSSSCTSSSSSSEGASKMAPEDCK